MPDLTPEARKALAYWPQIEEAAAARMTTSELWDTIREAADELGLDEPGVTLRGVSQLRSIATTIQSSGRRLERLADSADLTGNHVAEAPWSRSMAERNAQSIYQVRYQHTTLTAEGPETNWRTSVFYGNLPGSVGELRSAIEEDAGQLANKYGVAHVDFTNVQVLTV